MSALAIRSRVESDDLLNELKSLSNDSLETRAPGLINALRGKSNKHSFYSHFTTNEKNRVCDYVESRIPGSVPKPKSAPKKRRSRSTPAPVPIFDHSLKTEYYDRLSKKPYCSDEKAHTHPRSKHFAIKHKYVQHNEPLRHYWIVLDYDKNDALERIKAENLPVPNFIVTSPETGTSHLFYGLKEPVLMGEKARKAPKEYLKFVRTGLTLIWGADPGYNGHKSRNPTHEFWNTVIPREKFYTLGELEKHFDLETLKSMPKPRARSGEKPTGRSSTLFFELRHFAYDNVINYRAFHNKAIWHAKILSKAEEINSKFDQPLSKSEINSAIKSVGEWVWDNYTGRVSDDEFSKRQSARGKRSGAARRKASEPARQRAAELEQHGMKRKDIAEELGVSAKTITRWLNTKK